MIPQNVGVFVDQDSYSDSFELACQLHTLKQQVGEFVIEEALKEQAKKDESAEIDARAALLMSPDTGFDERFAAVMSDILNDRHISQMDVDQPGLYRAPTDHGEDEEKPTDTTENT